jgi:hypothetical protein
MSYTAVNKENLSQAIPQYPAPIFPFTPNSSHAFNFLGLETNPPPPSPASSPNRSMYRSSANKALLVQTKREFGTEIDMDSIPEILAAKKEMETVYYYAEDGTRFLTVWEAEEYDCECMCEMEEVKRVEKSSRRIAKVGKRSKK